MSKLSKTAVITGSIGAGKSTLLTLLQEQGYAILSLDKLNAKLLEPFEQGFNALIHFDPLLLQKTGLKEKPFCLDKALLSQKMFSNPEYKRIIEAILHPMLIDAMHAWIEAQHQENPDKPCFVEIPLLFESGLDQEFKEIWFVDALPEKRLQRLIETRGMEEAQAKKVMASQMEDAIKRERSSLVFDNNGDLEGLGAQLGKALKDLEEIG